MIGWKGWKLKQSVIQHVSGRILKLTRGQWGHVAHCVFLKNCPVAAKT